MTGAPHFMAPMGMMDHLVFECPALQREARFPELIKLTKEQLDPNGVGVCGWCRRVWKARNR